MKATDRAEFFDLINLSYSTLMRPLPGPDSIKLWEHLLIEHSIEAVSAAFYRHMQVSRFPPMPSDILAYLLPTAENDGRPGVDEAWVTALGGVNEFESVRWTTETAQAMNPDVKRLLQTDEVGARMAFKSIYTRLCTEARAQKRPVEWVFSWGFDGNRREQLATSAVAKGLLSIESAKTHAPLLAAPEAESNPEQRVACKARIAQILENMPSATEKLARAKSAAAAAERFFLESLKADTARRVAEYERSHA